MRHKERAARQPARQRARLRLPNQSATGIARGHSPQPILPLQHRGQQVFLDGLDLAPSPAPLRASPVLQRRNRALSRLQRAGQGIAHRPGRRHGARLGSQFPRSPVLSDNPQCARPDQHQHHRPSHTAQQHNKAADQIAIPPAVSPPSPWPAQWLLSRMPINSYEFDANPDDSLPAKSMYKLTPHITPWVGTSWT